MHLVSGNLFIKCTTYPSQEMTDNARFNPGQSHQPLHLKTSDLDVQIFLRELQPKNLNFRRPHDNKKHKGGPVILILLFGESD